MDTITWKIHLNSNIRSVFELLTSSEGRKKFWSEEAIETDNGIHFLFPNGQTYTSKILKTVQNKEFHLDYFDSLVKFELEPLDNGGTLLTLINEKVLESDYADVNAGWVSVLMNLKAVADFDCDLRNHDATKTWDQGYADN